MKIKKFVENGLSFVKVSNKEITLTFCDLGASIYSIQYLGKEMLMTLKHSKDFLNEKLYHGKTIGRTANRIKGNLIEIDGNSYEISANEYGNTLHGGEEGLSTKHFDFDVKETKSSVKVVFKYKSKNKESGFPGALKVKVTYIVPMKGSKLKIKYEAKTNKPTLCDLTNHAFFTLGEESLESLSLKIKSSNYLLASIDELLPISKEPVTKELNFARYKPITKYLHSKKIEVGKANGYDHFFYFDEISKKPQVCLKCKDVVLKIKTDFEGVQIYSDNYEDDYEWLDVKGNKNRSIAIEPMDDYLHRKVLEPDSKYLRYIEYKFETLTK